MDPLGKLSAVLGRLRQSSAVAPLLALANIFNQHAARVSYHKIHLAPYPRCSYIVLYSFNGRRHTLTHLVAGAAPCDCCD